MQIRVLALALALVVASLAPHRGLAQAESVAALRSVTDSLLAYQTYYAETALKDPSNTGAARLKKRLAALTYALDSYLAGGAEATTIGKPHAAAVKEADRYSSAMAKRVQGHLAALGSLLPKLPATAGQLPPAATAEPEPTATTDAETDAEPGTTNTPGVRLRPTEATAGATGYYLFGFSLGLLLLVAAYLIYQQRRMAHQFIDRLTDLEVHAGFPREGALLPGFANQRLEELEKRYAESVSSVEARLVKLEKQSHGLRSEHSELAQQVYGTASLNERLATLEAHLGIVPVVPAAEIATQPLAVSPTPPTSNGTAAAVLEKPVATLTAPLEVVQSLSEWQLQTSLPDLAEQARNLLSLLKTEGLKPETLEAQLATVLQLGYVSAYNDNTLQHYTLLRSFGESLGILTEDEMAGRMALSDHYADHLTYETYFGVYGGHAKNFPDLTGQQEVLWQNETDTAITPRTVLRVLQPTVVLRKEGAKTVLRRGTYLVKS
ncbi:MAG: hypothetical protein SFY70_02005 [Bacteroidia bacterium]|nr:hypothetical protein [Bacteroidia bacterium]